MSASIPASRIVTVTPTVISAGGSGLDLSGLILTESTRVPIGTVKTLGSADAVGAFFGLSSAEYQLAVRYFAGYDNSPIKPASLLFSQYAAVDVAAYLRGGSVASMTLSELQAIAGTIALHVDGALVTSGAIDLSTAVSFSAAAAIIETALDGPACDYDSVSGAFVITSTTTGAASTITVADVGAAATALKLTAATAAVTSQGSDAMTPAGAMAAVVANTQNFASFMSAFKPSTDDMVAFAEWNNGKSNRYAYVLWDDNAALTTGSDETTALARIIAAGYAATLGLYDPIDGAHKAAAVMGVFASIDFARARGRVNLAFRSQAGLTAGVTSELVADQLIANGCNFYGAYATAAQGFVFFYPGAITGAFKWADTLVNEIWMTNNFQLTLMDLLTAVTNVPYNDAGNSLIKAALQGPIDEAVNFGAIQPGVTLSALQRAEINNAAGADIADTIVTRGWYLQVLAPPPEVRAERGSPIINFWYADGGSVQRIALNSAEVQ